MRRAAGLRAGAEEIDELRAARGMFFGVAAGALVFLTAGVALLLLLS